MLSTMRKHIAASQEKNVGAFTSLQGERLQGLAVELTALSCIYLTTSILRSEMQQIDSSENELTIYLPSKQESLLC